MQGKKILFGISGGIAAYKCSFLVRLLVKEGADVKVVMTKSAADFVTPQTLSVLSKNEVKIDFFDSSLRWNNHVELAEWADLMIIAPLTANSLSKMVHGQCDNLLMAVYFSARCPVMVAPAMDLEMYRHAVVQANLKELARQNVVIIPAENGELASGLSGEGRMAEPENILSRVKEYFQKDLPLKAKKVLINAGPTYEAIDEVRFIANRSSGKMGMAIAEEMARQGAEVTLVLGPSHLIPLANTIDLIRVESADEMHREMLKSFSEAEIVVCTAAVADFKPKSAAKGKIKKDRAGLHLELVHTTDILEDLGKQKKNQFLVGFALESQDLLQHAAKKLQTKNLDMVVANLKDESNPAFNVDYNRVTVLEKGNKITEIGFKSKQEVAVELTQLIISRLK